ncbi:four helix bundle protein [Mucilaginibacter arboris]|uniref:Four helix bundle protein n=1 Tax=Mucilaginibacter arboris TaxID=2682090 RepID=A0A7K1SYN1_9SPHI|nr:four helix bundle protein [Mucilaginibacter arboris]MVN22436.1 four helix bundle protein [Mucilaginibacter arboris]
MAFRFEELNIWKKAMDLNEAVFLFSKTLPKDELFVLSSQMKRASDSVVLNIAEGSTGQTKASFKLFLNYSLRSAIEVVSCLFIAKRRSYIDEIQFKTLYEEHDVLVKMITNMKKSLD